MTPNSSETPTSSQELADVLRKIADAELGSEGKRITPTLFSWAWEAVDDIDRFGDHVFGEIIRAVKAHWNPENHLKDWMIDIEDGGGGQFVVYIKDRIGHKIGVGQGPLTLAAARAYQKAIQEGQR